MCQLTFFILMDRIVCREIESLFDNREFFSYLTFLLGVWEMNFKFMPKLDWRYDYLMAWFIMTLAGLFTWWHMKQKNWY